MMRITRGATQVFHDPQKRTQIVKVVKRAATNKPQDVSATHINKGAIDNIEANNKKKDAFPPHLNNRNITQERDLAPIKVPEEVSLLDEFLKYKAQYTKSEIPEEVSHLNELLKQYKKPQPEPENYIKRERGYEFTETNEKTLISPEMSFFQEYPEIQEKPQETFIKTSVQEPSSSSKKPDLEQKEDTPTANSEVQIERQSNDKEEAVSFRRQFIDEAYRKMFGEEDVTGKKIIDPEEIIALRRQFIGEAYRKMFGEEDVIPTSRELINQVEQKINEDVYLANYFPNLLKYNLSSEQIAKKIEETGIFDGIKAENFALKFPTEEMRSKFEKDVEKTNKRINKGIAFASLFIFSTMIGASIVNMQDLLPIMKEIYERFKTYHDDLISKVTLIKENVIIQSNILHERIMNLPDSESKSEFLEIFDTVKTDALNNLDQDLAMFKDERERLEKIEFPKAESISQKTLKKFAAGLYRATQVACPYTSAILAAVVDVALDKGLTREEAKEKIEQFLDQCDKIVSPETTDFDIQGILKSKGAIAAITISSELGAGEIKKLVETKSKDLFPKLLHRNVVNGVIAGVPGTILKLLYKQALVSTYQLTKKELEDFKNTEVKEALKEAEAKFQQKTEQILTHIKSNEALTLNAFQDIGLKVSLLEKEAEETKQNQLAASQSFLYRINNFIRQVI